MTSHSRYHDLMIFGLRSLFEHKIVGHPCDDLSGSSQAEYGRSSPLCVSFAMCRVMIAYSGSMESAKAMKRFVQLRLWPDVRLKIETFNSTESQGDRLVRRRRVLSSTWLRGGLPDEPGRGENAVLVAGTTYCMGRPCRGVGGRQSMTNCDGVLPTRLSICDAGAIDHVHHRCDGRYDARHLRRYAACYRRGLRAIRTPSAPGRGT